MPQILGSSVSYRVAVGPQQGRKAFMIRTIRPLDKPDPGLERVAKANGFSLHAGVSCEGHQKNKRERLCRYIARPAVAIPRLSQSSTGKVVYSLKARGSRRLTGMGRHRWPSTGAAIRRGFHCAIGCPRAKTQGQSNSLPWRIGTQPPIAWAGHSRQAW